MARKEVYSDAEIIAALTECKGAIFIASKRIGCSPDTIYRRAEKVPEVAEVIRNERAEVVDAAELKLVEAVERGEPWAVMLTLRTIGKDRGYTERTETTAIPPEHLNRAVELELARLARAREASMAGPAPHRNGHGHASGAG